MWPPRLKNVGIALSRVHPLIYMAIYLAAIPVFATVYLYISSDFYSPYGRWEPAATEDRQRIASLIKEAISGQLKYRKPSPDIVIDGWQVDNNNIKVFNADSADGSTIDFELRIVITKDTPPGTTVTLSHIPVSFLGQRGEVVRKAGYNRSSANNVRPTKFRVDRLISDQQKLAQALYGAIFRSYSESVLIDEALVLSEGASKQIDEFLSGVRGNPSAVSGTLGRMLYFSAIVMTTVGFGDVVPLTPRARSFVGIQAVIGVLLAGLFLNAAAYQASQSSRK